MSSLKEKAKNVETSPSMISEDYVHAFFHCACCGKKFGEADYRREDIEEMQKHSKPLCKNCAKFLSGWQAKNDKERWELKQKLQQKYDECKRIEETTASPLWREGARWNRKLIEELLEKEAQPT
jgi:hypothetical protein